MNGRTRLKSLPFSLVAITMLIASADASAADKARIQTSILKAQKYILSQRVFGPQGALATLAYIKSGGDKKLAAIEQSLKEINAKIQSSGYRPFQHHVYEASVDIMFLEAVDGEAYKLQMEAITTFLLSTQQANGSWFYNEKIEPDCGDTSITQYAILGLWAAARAGIEVPVTVWERAARWQMSKQLEDGGFCYHPFESKLQPNFEDQMTSASMTAAGSSNLLIIRRVLFDDAEMDTEVRPVDSKRRFGVLERFVDEKPERKKLVNTTPTLRPGPIDKSLKDSVRWTSSHFIDRSARTEGFFLYYLYCIERVAALTDVEMLGTHDWYDEGAEELIKRQAPDGSWTDRCSNVPATAFGLMFLSKATATIVTPKKKVNLLGGGLQIGGRGLPSNLGAVQVKDGNVSSRKIVGAVDNLLIELERSADAKVEDVQAAVVDAVQLDRPEELIGQMARLRKLAVDSRTEVRRTALWALGRSGDISAAKLLIDGLLDNDISVMREASLGLCILARRPEGCGKPIDPTDDTQMNLKEDATDDERNAKLKEWQDESKKWWHTWYRKYRPYDEREDRSAVKQSVK